MAIPIQDLEWAWQQQPCVMRLFMQCWACDPYGSRWMVLNHTLSEASFFRAKKVITERGLFIFKSERSFLNNRERAYWMVQNLHGARRPNFGINPPNQNAQNNINSPDQKQEPDSQNDKPDSQKNESHYQNRESIESEIADIASSQNASITSHQRLTNSSKEISEALGVDCFGDESDRDTAFEERVTSASPNKENVKAEGTNPTEVQPDLVNQPNSDSKQVAQSADKEAPGALINESTNEVLEQPYKFDWRTTEASERSKAQNLAIEAQRKTKEYQDTFKAGAARIRAIFEEKKKQKFAQRQANLRGDNPMTFAERQVLGSYKRELETNRPQITQEDFWDDSGDC